MVVKDNQRNLNLYSSKSRIRQITLIEDPLIEVFQIASGKLFSIKASINNFSLAYQIRAGSLRPCLLSTAARVVVTGTPALVSSFLNSSTYIFAWNFKIGFTL